MQRLAEATDLKSMKLQTLDSLITTVRDSWVDMPSLLKLRWTAARASCMLGELPEETEQARQELAMGQVTAMHLIDTTSPTWSGSDPKCGSILLEEISKLEETIRELESGRNPTALSELAETDTKFQSMVNNCNLFVQARASPRTISTLSFNQ